jgi:hypothetical protein
LSAHNYLTHNCLFIQLAYTQLSIHTIVCTQLSYTQLSCTQSSCSPRKCRARKCRVTKIKVVYSRHPYITKKQLNLTSYHLNQIIHVMSLAILSKLLFFVQSDIHQHPISSISNNVPLNSCYFIMGLFSIYTSSIQILFILVIHQDISTLDSKSSFADIRLHHHCHPFNHSARCLRKS